MRNTCILFILFFGLTRTFAQADSCLSYDAFISLVQQNHPIAQQANLSVKSAEANILKARGYFDPYLFGNISNKNFDDKNYFKKIEGGLKIPTWYGVEFNSKVTQNSGTFLNPENTVPSEGLLQAGISVNLAQGLLIDKRRSTLKQAQILATASEYERTIKLNDLLFVAANDYWKWVKTWHKKQLYNDVLALSKLRFEWVKKSFFGGDKPAIDTVEAMLQIQNWEIKRNEQSFEEIKARLQLSNHLWTNNLEPLVIQGNLTPCLFSNIATPPPIEIQERDSQLVNTDSNPKIRSYNLQIQALEIEKQYKADLLKPKLTVNYNFLSPASEWNTLDPYVQTENNKWGLTMSYPIPSRKQRADVRITNFKIESTELKQAQAQLEVENKLKTYFQEQQVAFEQNLLLSNTIINYQRLLAGERSRFNNGESSIFLINSRESKLVEAKLKQIDFETQYRTALIAYKWSAYKLTL
jgi:outer membrane protein TolC